MDADLVELLQSLTFSISRVAVARGLKKMGILKFARLTSPAATEEAIEKHGIPYMDAVALKEVRDDCQLSCVTWS
jgi:hypothetical protein